MESREGRGELSKSFYDNPLCAIKVGSSISSTFPAKRGIRQGAVLSPALFLLVIDDQLSQLASAKCGVLVKDTYVGSTGHADDLRSTTSNVADLHFQANTILKFARTNHLKLNSSLFLLPLQFQAQSFPLDLKPSDTCRCLGFWWTPTLSPKSVD